ncbi:MAG TPA: helix-turn-helix transcriptional regulator [Polyangiaceae bacterium]
MALQFQTEPARRRPTLRDDLSGVRIAVCPSEPPPPPEPDALVDIAVAADATAGPVDLASFWDVFIDRKLQLDAVAVGPDRHYVFARGDGVGASRLVRLETTVVVRALGGEQQKLIAAELEIACSTASKWFTQGLVKLGLARRPIPLPLVIAAQARAAGQTPFVAARSATVRREGSFMVLVSVPKPKIRANGLTPAEEEVARLLVDGDSRWEIATKRATSAQTVACQLRGIYSKLGVSGRYALIRRGVELGWFA